MARCPGCNKFPALDSSAEPELDLSIEGVQITGTVRIVLTSECCGEEIKEYNFDIDHDANDAIQEAIQTQAQLDGIELPEELDLEADGVELEVEPDTFEVTDRTQTTDRHGKPIKSSRYMKHFWGFSGQVTVTIRYPVGDKTIETNITVDLEDEIPASGMEECC